MKHFSKRLFSIMLTGTLCFGILTACGSKEEQAESQQFAEEDIDMGILEGLGEIDDPELGTIDVNAELKEEIIKNHEEAVDVTEDTGEVALGNLPVSDQFDEDLLLGTYCLPYVDYDDVNREEKLTEVNLLDAIENAAFCDRFSEPWTLYETKSTTTAVPVYVSFNKGSNNYAYGSRNYKWDDDDAYWQEKYLELCEEDPETANERLKEEREINAINTVTMYFADEAGKIVTAEYFYTYEVNGNVLTCRQLESSLSGFSMDGPGPNYPSNDIIQNYHFGFNGTNLVLERGGATIELMPARVVELENASRDSSEETAVYSIEGGTNAENPYHDITGFYFGWFRDAEGTNFTADLHFSDGWKTKDCSLMMEGNHVSFSWDRAVGSQRRLLTGAPGEMEAEAERERQELSRAGQVDFHFIDQSEWGFTVIGEDGRLYPYRRSYLDVMFASLEKILPDNAEDELFLTEDDLSAIKENKDFILTDLREGFEAVGTVLPIEGDSGVVRFDSNILFAVDSAEVSEEGKSSLKEFLDIYIPIMEQQIADGNVAYIQIDGHTDTSGSYDYNMELSEKRANAVAAFVAECYPEASGYLATKGYSFEQPVFGPDGGVDMDASRRVEFRFIININGVA